MYCLAWDYRLLGTQGCLWMIGRGGVPRSVERAWGMFRGQRRLFDQRVVVRDRIQGTTAPTGAPLVRRGEWSMTSVLGLF